MYSVSHDRLCYSDLSPMTEFVALLYLSAQGKMELVNSCCWEDRSGPEPADGFSGRCTGRVGLGYVPDMACLVTGFQ